MISLEYKIQDIFIQCLLFNKTFIPLTPVRYELVIASYPMRVCGIMLSIVIRTEEKNTACSYFSGT